MARRIRKLSVESVNKIKYEKRQEFDESIFCEVYQRVGRCISKIVEDNILLLQKEKEGYCEDEQLSNMIAFIGERGMGKSSAMLSYAHFLKMYDQGSAGDFKIFSSGENVLTFSVLTRIDVAMIGNGESILDIILARIWDNFYERDKLTGKRSDILAGEIREDFSRVKNTYRNYKRIATGKELLQDMTSVRELHELAACMNLRSEIKKLVEDYLAYENDKSFLVISLDDLDMTMGDLYETMEQIRLFLMIPKVIVLSTINLTRFMMAYKKHLLGELLYQSKKQKDDRKKINRYVNDYMAKILPSNMRINVPRLGMVGGIEYEIKLDGYLKDIYGDIKPQNVQYDEKKLMFILLTKYSNILFLPYDEQRHFLQDDSLRKMVNKIYTLLNMLKEHPDDRFDLVYQWYFDKLVEYSQEVPDMDLVEKLLEMGNRYINASIVNILGEISLGKKMQITGDDYGNILRYLFLIEDAHKAEIFNFISLLYSIQISYELRADRSYISDICSRDIFYTVLSESYVRGMRSGIRLEERRALGRLLNCSLNYTQGERTAVIVKKNAGILMEIFVIANFCGFSIWNKEKCRYVASGLTDEDTEDIPSPGIEENLSKIGTHSDRILKSKSSEMNIVVEKIFSMTYSATVSIDNFLFNMIRYEENLKGYIENVYCSIEEMRRGEITEKIELSDKELRYILEAEEWKNGRYRDWKKEYGIPDDSQNADIGLILPIQSVEVMVYLAKEMSYIRRKHINMRSETFEGLQKEWEGLLEGLKEIEEFCGYEELGNISYYKRLKAYWDMLAPQNISEEIRKKLDMPSEEGVRLRHPSV